MLEWKRELVASLDEAEVFRLGDFVLKSGAASPIYIDLRRLIAFPTILVCSLRLPLFAAANLDRPLCRSRPSARCGR